MGSDYRPMQDYLKRVYQKLDVSDAVDGVEVIGVYKEIVGELIAKLSNNPRFEKGQLIVNIDSPALRQELSYKRQSLTDKINERLKRKVVRGIVFL